MWYNEEGITITEMEDLMKEAYTPQFGETKQENLTSFLLCEAFERRRFDPAGARAFHLAAMIISRVSST